MENQRTEYIQATEYERSNQRKSQRNGYYERNWTTRVGTLELDVPRTRDGKFSPTLFERYQRNAPDNFTANVMDKLPEEKKHMKYRRWFSKHPYLPAVAVVLFFFVASLFSGWGKGTELVVSKKDDLIIEGDTVIVPEDIVVSGDLFIKNGNLKVIGQIEGDVTLVNGELLSENEMTASIDNISGELKQIDRALKWAWYEVNKFVSDLFSFN